MDDDEELTFGEHLKLSLEELIELEREKLKREYQFTDAYHRQYWPVIPLSEEK